MLNAPATTANSPLIWGVTLTGTATDTSGSCVDGSGNEQQLQTLQGYYLNEGSATVPSGNGSGVYNYVMFVKPSGVLEPTFDNVTIAPVSTTSAGTFSFQLCNYTSGDGIHAGVVVIDSSGDDSNVACLP